MPITSNPAPRPGQQLRRIVTYFLNTGVRVGPIRFASRIEIDEAPFRRLVDRLDDPLVETFFQTNPRAYGGTSLPAKCGPRSLSLSRFTFANLGVHVVAPILFPPIRPAPAALWNNLCCELAENPFQPNLPNSTPFRRGFDRSGGALQWSLHETLCHNQTD